jgi:SHAQKYF class myb-like DNA-binding protein
MNLDGQNNANKQAHGNAPIQYQPPNNLQPDMSQNPAGVGSSVVKDLLRVYESLTQSSTPQTSMDDFSGKSGPQSSGNFSAPQMPTQASGHTQQGQGAYLHPGATTMYNIPPPTYPPPQHFYGEQPPYGQQHYGMPQSGHENSQLQGYTMSGFDMPSGHPSSIEQSSEAQETDGEEPPEPSHGRLRRKRRGSEHSSSSAGQKGRKKSKASDGRWSKRFTWPDDLHRDFVSAIFDVGLKHSSPSTIMEHMPKHEQITTERIKSHLQKYRMHRVKSKKEFISSYEASLRGYQENGMDCVKSLTGGDTAAQLTYMEISGVVPSAPPTVPTKVEPPEQEQNRSPQQNEVLMLPQLTEAEKVSPMGAALGHLMGLFLSLKQELVAQRIAEGKKRAEAQAAADALSSAASMDPNTEGAGQTFKAGLQSGRTHIEESSIMKREMQNQMELQNKMRALKQQELNKYKSLPPSAQSGPVLNYESNNPAALEHGEHKLESRDSSHAQGAGESGGSDGDDVGRGENHPRGLSLGNQDDFWNTDVVDDQLFEFLMNN